jgi:transaldolase
MIDIFYDGTNFEKWANHPAVKGFTTNCTLLSTHTDRVYTSVYATAKPLLAGRPFSLQIWEDDTDAALQQIKDIHAIDASIYVKIPIVNTRGEYNDELFQYVVENAIPVNVTSLYTNEQVTHVRALLETSSAPEIISIFAGPVSDAQVDPTPFVHHTVKAFEGRAHSRVLWAGAREPYTIQRAESAGCHIITIPDVVMEKLDITKDATELSIQRVITFRNHALKGGLRIQ